MIKTILIQLKLSVTSTWDLLKYIEKYLPALDAMLVAVGFLAICYGVVRLVEWFI